MAHRKSAGKPGGDEALGTAARACSAPRLLYPHRGDDRIGVGHGLGGAAAASRHLPGGFLVPNLTCRACAIQASEGASMCAIPFGVNVNESGQIGAGLALETRYR